MPQTWLVVPGAAGTEGGIAAYDDQANQIGPAYTQLPGGASGWVIGERAIYDPSRPFEPIQINPDYPSFLTVSGSGAFQVQVGTSWANVNRGTSSNIQYGVAGSVDYTTAEGEPASLPIGFAAINKTGWRWAIRRDAEGNETMVRVPADATLAQLNQQYAGYTRWAKPEEVVAPALAWQIFNLSRSADPEDREVFRQFMRDLGVDPDAPPQDISGAIEMWLSINGTNLTSVSRYSFGPTGEPK